METILFWVVASCACLVVGIYFFFVRSRRDEKTPEQQ
jgi:hypothetical protein